MEFYEFVEMISDVVYMMTEDFEEDIKNGDIGPGELMGFVADEIGLNWDNWVSEIEDEDE